MQRGKKDGPKNSYEIQSLFFLPTCYVTAKSPQDWNKKVDGFPTTEFLPGVENW